MDRGDNVVSRTGGETDERMSTIKLTEVTDNSSGKKTGEGKRRRTGEKRTKKAGKKKAKPAHRP